jgi:hypothetical protein
VLVLFQRGRDIGCGTAAINPLKPKLVERIFENSVRNTKKTQLFTITNISWLMLFKEIIAVYSENYMKLMYGKCRFIDC